MLGTKVSYNKVSMCITIGQKNKRHTEERCLCEVQKVKDACHIITERKLAEHNLKLVAHKTRYTQFVELGKVVEVKTLTTGAMLHFCHNNIA
jgi:hypothetical protein